VRRVIRIGITVIVLSIIAVVAVQFLQFQRANETAAQETTSLVQDEAVVVRDDMTVTVSATGAIMPARSVSLSFELGAPVQEILVGEGQAVQQGDVLARLDVANLESALTNAQITLDAQQASYAALTAPARDVDIAVAQAAVDVAEAQLGSASLGADPNQVEIARLQAELARNTLWQTQLQRDAGAAQTQQQIEQAAELGFDTSGIPEPPNPADNVSPPITQAEFGVELADVNAQGVVNQPADMAGLSAANAQLVAAQVQLDRLLNGPTDMELQITDMQLQIAQLAVDQAQAALNRAVLTAPFAGIIAKNNLIVGDIPSSDEPAIQLIDTASYYVDVSVDETDIVKLEVGQTVNVRVDALPTTEISGTVTRVAATPVRAGQLITYTVRVTLDPTAAPLRVGMTSTATIVVSQLEDVLIVPNRFIRVDRATQQAYVTIQRGDGAFEEVPVTLGVRNETESQIVSGIDAGQRVVLLPRESLNPIN
jgi:HlyD family secretion protein